jgi:FtsP/CotA-like multicopper oxidase with cupredoxin domain
MPINTTIHWHGLEYVTMQNFRHENLTIYRQTGTPWSDGVPGLGQQPILPGKSFVYRFIASPPGTHWYHAHSRMTLFDGLYGGIFIRYGSLFSSSAACACR